MTREARDKDLPDWLGREEDWTVAGRDFRQIFAEFYPLIFRFFAKHGLDEEDSYDLAQETLLRVYKSLPSFRGESRFGTWVFQVTANVYKNYCRTRLTQKRDALEVPLEESSPGDFGDSALESGDADPLDGMLAGERSQKLRRAFEELPPQLRRCVMLRVDQDLKYREIAVLMDISIDTVKAHLFQARQILRSKLSKYLEDSGA